MQAQIELVPYDPGWAEEFERRCRDIQGALGEAAVAVEHIGSTSVPGLAAKPIVDIQVQVPSFEPMEAYRDPLERLGYEYRPDDDAGHRFFRLDVDGRRVVNMHVVEAGSDWGTRDLAFRDYLRAHPDEARRYEELKRELATKFSPAHVQRYAEGKSPYIESVYAKIRAQREDL